jgi:hypothetical protein
VRAGEDWLCEHPLSLRRLDFTPAFGRAVPLCGGFLDAAEAPLYPRSNGKGRINSKSKSNGKG